MTNSTHPGRTPRLRLLLLGPPAVRAATGPTIGLGFGRPAAVAAVLGTAPGDHVSSERLLDQIWRRGMDRRDLDVLKNAVYQLNSRTRKVFGRRLVVAVGNGYRLAVDVRTDVEAFERGAAALRTLSSRRACADPTRIASAATRLELIWSACEPSGSFDHLPLVADRLTSLIATRRSVRQIRLQAMLDAGNHDSIVGEVVTAAEREPFDEAVCALAMTTLARCGRVREAVEHYTRFRNRLVETAGLDPTPQLQQLHRDLLRGTSTIAWRPLTPPATLRTRTARAAEAGWIGVRVTRTPRAERRHAARREQTAPEMRPDRLLHLMEVGRFGEAAIQAESLASEGVRSGNPEQQWFASIAAATIKRLRGDPGGMDNTCQVGFGGRAASTVRALQLHEWLWHQGQAGVLEPIMRTGVAPGAGPLARLLWAHTLLSDGATRRAAEVWATTRAAVHTCMPDRARESGRRSDPGRSLSSNLPVLILAAELLASGIDDRAASVALLEALEPHQGQWVIVGPAIACWGPVDRHRSMLARALGRLGEASDLNRRAEAEYKRAGVPLSLTDVATASG